MRRGHVTANTGGAAEAPPIAHSARVPPGVCPKCRKHVGRAVRAHAITCGVEAVAAAPPSAVSASPPQVSLAPQPLIGHQPKPQEEPPAISYSPRLPRLVHGNDRRGHPVPGRRRREGSLAQRQAEAVAAMKRQAGIA